MEAKVRERQALRLQFLNHVYDAVGGPRTTRRNIHAITTGMGLHAGV